LFTIQLFVYNSAVCLLSQFCKQTADFSVFSCLFTFQLFVYFLSFVNKQLFVYISQQNPGFGFFVPSWPQSNASIRSQFLTAVCLHFDSFLFTFNSCLFTFSQFFVNKQLTLFTFDSCLFTFSQFFVNKQLFVYISQSAVCLLFLSFQLFVYFFSVFVNNQLFVYISQSAVCLHFSVFSCLFTFSQFL